MKFTLFVYTMIEMLKCSNQSVKIQTIAMYRKTKNNKKKFVIRVPCRQLHEINRIQYELTKEKMIEFQNMSMALSYLYLIRLINTQIYIISAHAYTHKPINTDSCDNDDV